MQPLTIWSNYPLNPDELKRFEESLTPHYVVYEAKGASRLADADVAFGQPDAEGIMHSNRLRLIAITSAGYTKYDRDDLRAALRARGAILTNSSSVFAEACAQHVLSWILAGTRALPQAMRNQLGPRGWPHHELRTQSRPLRGSKVLLVGFGTIASQLAKMLAPFDPRIIGFRRNPTGDEAIPVHRIEEVDTHLGSADHVVDILPESKATENFFNAARFAKMPRSATFYNIGRGKTVDTEALHDALASQRIQSAFLDVTHPEPLPVDHPLWSLPNCTITPHTGGGFGSEREAQLTHFVQNIRRLEREEPLVDRIV